MCRAQAYNPGENIGKNPAITRGYDVFLDFAGRPRKQSDFDKDIDIVEARVGIEPAYTALQAAA
jgi:hypothetical protein